MSIDFQANKFAKIDKKEEVLIPIKEFYKSDDDKLFD